MRPVSAQTAFVLPFMLFMSLLGGVDLLDHLFEGEGSLWIAEPKYWIFPLQTLCCGAALVFLWPQYALKSPKHWLMTVLVGVLVLVIWIAPQELLNAPPRLKGFDPDYFQSQTLYWSSLGLRFLRLVVVVPLLEEIFWRGFLLRYLIEPRFEKVAFGSFSWSSFSIVTLAFGLAHWGPDFVPALMTGALYNWVAYRTRSLGSCILAHAVTNLLLGFYIMATGQWGFW